MNKRTTLKKQRILIIGSGGREHAIGWKISQSKKAGQIFFAPGNAGTSKIGVNVDIKANDVNALLRFAKKEKIDLTLAIPDECLALGIVDLFKKNKLRIFGPNKKAARLESSKIFAKRFMNKHGLPTAKFKTFSDIKKALSYIETHSLPIVIKANGLALGKGVVIAKTKKEAQNILEDIFVNKIFGDSGNSVVIEEFLEGIEVSIHAFSDGKSFSMFPIAQDHKKIGEGDTGPNTGGMGTIAPVPFVSKSFSEKIIKKIVTDTLKNIEKDGFVFSGVLFPGLMLTKNGPKILEYNARFGDPETETFMRLLETDLLDIINSCIDQTLERVKIKWRSSVACTVMLVSKGYPGEYKKGQLINGIDKANNLKDIVVFHSGTIQNDKNILTSGGRVLGVSAIGKDTKEALNKAYKAIKKISFKGMVFRRDIGKKALIQKLFS